MIFNSKFVVALALLAQYYSTVSALPLSSHTIERPLTSHSREIYGGEPALVSRVVERRSPGSGFVSSKSTIQKQGSAKQTKFIPSPNRKVNAESRPSLQSTKDKNQPNTTIKGGSNKVYRPESKANGPVVGRKSATRPSRMSDKDCQGQRDCQSGRAKLSSNSKDEHKTASGPLYAIGMGEMRFQEPNVDEQYDE